MRPFGASGGPFFTVFTVLGCFGLIKPEYNRFLGFGEMLPFDKPAK